MSVHQADLFSQGQDLERAASTPAMPTPALHAVPPPAPPVPGPVGAVPPSVRVRRSAKRRKTIQARMVEGVLEVLVPAWMSAAEEQEAVASMIERFRRKRSTEAVDLDARARALARRFGLKTPASIRWVDNQQWRWGSCTPADGSIRISSRMAEFPAWVLDAVIVHELAHLDVFGHGPDFHALADRYPLAERARGFLIAKGMGE